MLQLSVDRLCVLRNEHPLFEGVSCTLKSGTALFVKGPNGCGKTSFLKALVGLCPKETGEVSLQQLMPVSATLHLTAHTHFISHTNALKGGLTVLENLAFLKNLMEEGSGASSLLSLSQDIFSVLPLAHCLVSNLSFGQRRRVSLTRLQQSRRPLWILDEPTSGLDSQSIKNFTNLLKTHLTEGGMAIVATHEDFGEMGDILMFSE